MIINKWAIMAKSFIINEKLLYPENSIMPNAHNIMGSIDAYKYRIYQTETGFFSKQEGISNSLYIGDKKELLLYNLSKAHEQFIIGNNINWFKYDRIITSFSYGNDSSKDKLLDEINYSYIDDSLYEYYMTNSKYIKENGYYYIYAYDLDIGIDRLFKMTLKDIVRLNIEGYMLSGNGFIYTKQYAGSWLNGHNSDYAYSEMGSRDFLNKLMPEILERAFATM